MKQWLSKNKGLLAALALTLAFVAAEGAVFYWKGGYTVAFVPVAMLAVWLFVVRLEVGLLLMALLTPFAVNMALAPGMELSMPVEPLMIVFTLMFLFRVLASRRQGVAAEAVGGGVRRSFWRHPVTLLLTASLLWMAFTSVTSRMPWVSFKYLIARLWFVVPFFYAATMVFANRVRIKQFFWATP